MRTVRLIITIVSLSLGGVASARAQVPVAGVHAQFEVEPLVRAAPAWPKQRIDVQRTSAMPRRSVTCRMRVVRGASPADSMPVARRETSIAQTMPIVPGTCDSSGVAAAKVH